MDSLSDGLSLHFGGGFAHEHHPCAWTWLRMRYRSCPKSFSPPHVLDGGLFAGEFQGRLNLRGLLLPRAALKGQPPTTPVGQRLTRLPESPPCSSSSRACFPQRILADGRAPRQGKELIPHGSMRRMSHRARARRKNEPWHKERKKCVTFRRASGVPLPTSAVRDHSNGGAGVGFVPTC